MGQQRSISLNAWSRSTLDLASGISKFFFIRMNCFAGAPSLNSVPWYTYSNLDEKERKFDTDGRDCEKRRIEFFFRCGTISLEGGGVLFEIEYLDLIEILLY